MDVRHDVALEMARLYHTLSPEGIKQLTSILVPMRFNKGDIILKEGEVAHYIYWIHKGFLRQFYFKNKKDLTEHLSFEGGMVQCIESFYKQEPTILQIEAMENSIVYGIPYDKIEKLSEESSELGIFYRKILEHSLIVSQIKANMLRFESAQNRYRIMKKRQPEAMRRAPLNMIASFLQMTPETLSRVRAKELESND